MSCATQTVTFEASTTSRDGSPSGTDERTSLLRRGRRHSYNTTPRRRQSSICSADAVFVKVDLFLTELRSRLDRLEKYRQESLTNFDAQLERAYQALRDVRDSCAPSISGEVLWGAARQRASMLVDTLETGYNDMIPSRDGLEHKAQEGMRLMEMYLSELESRMHERKNYFIETGWRKVDESLSASREIFEDGIDKALRAKDILSESISHALSRAAETTLIRYEDLPIPWRNNQHILKGYRFNKTSVECLTSIFHAHNEMFNIWSHGIGLIAVLAVAFYFYPSSAAFSSSSKTDILVAACFFTAACKCLICSLMWHTMSSISDKCLHERFACVDYTGISLLVAASILSIEWTAFYCEPVSRSIYMTLTTALGIAGAILPWRESFNRADMNWFRVTFFVTLAVTGFAPVLQLNYTRGAEWTFYFYAPIAKSMMVYFTGALIYASQVPEKWWPGTFDYIGCSHNIWHVAVVFGIIFHYTAMTEFFQGAFRRANGGCCLG